MADILHEEIFSSLSFRVHAIISKSGGGQCPPLSKVGGQLPPLPPFSYTTVICDDVPTPSAKLLSMGVYLWL